MLCCALKLAEHLMYWRGFLFPLSFLWVTDSESRLYTLKVKYFTDNHYNQNSCLFFLSPSDIANPPYTASFSTPHNLPKSQASALSTENLQTESR